MAKDKDKKHICPIMSAGAMNPKSHQEHEWCKEEKCQWWDTILIGEVEVTDCVAVLMAKKA